MLLRAGSTPAQRRRAWEAHERWRLTHERRLARQLTLDIRSAIEQAAGAVEAGGDPARALAALQRVAAEHLRDRLRETWTGAAAQMRDALGKGARVVLERKRVTVAPDDAAMAAIDRLAERRAGPLAQSVGARITRAVQEAYAAGEGQRGGAVRILDLLADGFPARRAAVIARTETHSAAQSASQAVASDIVAESGVQLRKVWVAAQDERTRESHTAADGQAVLPDGSFSVGAATLRFPGDPEGPPGEIINCRCVQVFEPVPPGERVAAARQRSPDDERIDDRRMLDLLLAAPAGDDDPTARAVERALLALSPRVEHAAVLVEGRQVARLSGSRNQVEIPVSVIETLTARNAVLTHTHTRYIGDWSSGLSPEDLAFVARHNLRSLRIVLPNGVRIEAARVGPAWGLAGGALAAAITEAQAEAEARLLKDERLTPNEAALLVDHVVARSLASRVGFRYRVFMPDGQKSQRIPADPTRRPVLWVSSSQARLIEAWRRSGRPMPRRWLESEICVQRGHLIEVPG